MKKTTWRSLLLFCLSLFFLLIPEIVASADLPVLDLKVPLGENMRIERVIFSASGNKLAVLLHESRPNAKRQQAIYVYDFSEKTWLKVVGIVDGVEYELEPLALNTDGTKLAYRSKDDLLIHDFKTNLTAHRVYNVGSMTKAAFSPDSTYLALLEKAEWELPTSIGLLKLTVSAPAVMPVVTYKDKNKANGPIVWAEKGNGFYYIEEETFGTTNAYGVLMGYSIEADKRILFYNTSAKTARVTNYFYTAGEEYRAMIIRFYDEAYEQSHYGLIIQKEGDFVYGDQLKNWRDPVQLDITNNFSAAGWVGKQFFCWANYGDKGTDLYIYDVKEKKLTNKQFAEQVYLCPTGVIIRLGR